jgi:hypothetical protein
MTRGWRRESKDAVLSLKKYLRDSSVSKGDVVSDMSDPMKIKKIKHRSSRTIEHCPPRRHRGRHPLVAPSSPEDWRSAGQGDPRGKDLAAPPRPARPRREGGEAPSSPTSPGGERGDPERPPQEEEADGCRVAEGVHSSLPDQAGKTDLLHGPRSCRRCLRERPREVQENGPRSVRGHRAVRIDDRASLRGQSTGRSQRSRGDLDPATIETIEVVLGGRAGDWISLLHHEGSHQRLGFNHRRELRGASPSCRGPGRTLAPSGRSAS